MQWHQLIDSSDAVRLILGFLLEPHWHRRTAWPFQIYLLALAAQKILCIPGMHRSGVTVVGPIPILD
jgi:undecaprenyl pyrophosphate phosphatase UppP